MYKMRRNERLIKDFYINMSFALYNASGSIGCLCPICGMCYSLDEMTPEHVPPESVGGKVIILTCTRCNWGAGSKIDSQFKAKHKLETISRGILNHNVVDVPGIIDIPSLGNLKLNASYSDEAGSVGFHLMPNGKEINDPVAVELFNRSLKKQMLENGKVHLEFGFTLKDRYHGKKFKFAILKSAFLVATARFGYRYGLNKMLNNIRQLLLDAIDDGVFGDSDDYVYLDLPDKFTGCNKNSISILYKPVTALLICFGRDAVVLPFFGSPKNLRSFFPSDSIIEFAGIYQPWSKKPEMVLDLYGEKGLRRGLYRNV